MRRSPLARILSVVIALPAAVGALVLLSMGGTRMWRAFQMFDFSLTGLLPGLALQTAGIALLLAAVITAIWSSVGLLTLGILSLFGVVSVIIPAVALGVLRSGVLPLEAYEVVVSGILQLTFTVLVAAGTAAALARRAKRRTHGAVHALALIGSPVLILVGIALAIAGLRAFQVAIMQSFGTAVDPMAAVLHLLGVVMIIAGVILARWSPMSLLLPAALIGGLSIYVLLPMPLPEFLGANPYIYSFLLMAGGATAAVLIAASIMLAIVRGRALRGADSNDTATRVPHPYAQQQAQPYAGYDQLQHGHQQPYGQQAYGQPVGYDQQQPTSHEPQSTGDQPPTHRQL